MKALQLDMAHIPISAAGIHAVSLGCLACALCMLLLTCHGVAAGHRSIQLSVTWSMMVILTAFMLGAAFLVSSEQPCLVVGIVNLPSFSTVPSNGFSTFGHCCSNAGSWPGIPKCHTGSYISLQWSGNIPRLMRGQGCSGSLKI